MDVVPSASATISLSGGAALSYRSALTAKMSRPLKGIKGRPTCGFSRTSSLRRQRLDKEQFIRWTRKQLRRPRAASRLASAVATAILAAVRVFWLRSICTDLHFLVLALRSSGGGRYSGRGNSRSARESEAGNYGRNRIAVELFSGDGRHSGFRLAVPD